jgi:hypothetical protein
MGDDLIEIGDTVRLETARRGAVEETMYVFVNTNESYRSEDDLETTPGK